MSRRLSPRFWLPCDQMHLCLVLLLSSLVLIAVAANPRQTFAQNGAPPGHPLDIADLQQLALNQGTLRLIAKVDTAFTPVGELSSLAAFSQQRRIKQAQQTVASQLEAQHATVIGTFDTIPYMVLEVDADGLAALAVLDAVITLEEDRIEYPSLAQSVPDIQGTQAWSAGYTGSGQAIVIIDSGVEKSHAAFGNGSRVVAEACFSTTYGPNHTVTTCPDGSETSLAAGSGIDCVAVANTLGLSGAAADCTHGTHVAGIAAGNDGTANKGVAPDATIIAIQAGSIVTTTDSIGFYTSDIIYALQHVLTLHNSGTYTIAAVNMSLGGSIKYTGYCDVAESARKTAIDNLRSAGIATVIAGGNSSYTDGLAAPACISSAVSVGATYDVTDQIVYFSNTAAFLDLLAPGLWIDAAVPGNNTGQKSGTSMAAPHVAGAWALIREAAPTASVNDILTAFKNTGTLIDDDYRYYGANSFAGSGIQDLPRINVSDALQTLLTPTATATATASPTPTNTAVSPVTPTATPTAPQTATPYPSATATVEPTHTATPMPTATPTATATESNTITPIPTATSTDTPVLTATTTPLPTPPTTPATPIPTATATASATATVVPTSTATPTATGTDTPISTATSTPLATRTGTATTTPLPTATTAATATATPLPTITITATASPLPTMTATRTDTAMPTGIATATSMMTPIPTATGTRTNVPVSTSTATATPTATGTDTPISTGTATAMATSTATGSLTPPTTVTVPTATETSTMMPTLTLTATPQSSVTSTFVPTAMPFSTPTAAPTATPTRVESATPLATVPVTATATSTAPPMPTNTPTLLSTLIPTSQETPTPTAISAIPIATVAVAPNQPAIVRFSAPGGGQVLLELPAGAVDQPTILQVTLLAPPTDLPTTLRFAGQIFAIDAYQGGRETEGFIFQQPVTLTLTYADTDVVGLDESKLIFYFFDPSTATWLTDGIVIAERRPAANQLVIVLTHLTDFGLFASETTASALREQLYLPIIRHSPNDDFLP